MGNGKEYFLQKEQNVVNIQNILFIPYFSS